MSELTRLQTVKGRLEKRNYAVRLFETAEDARNALLDALREAKTVGIGGSATIQGLDIADALRENGTDVLWHWLPQEIGRDARREAMNAEVYLASANALTMDGRLLFIDGTGNRVGAICYGPGKVILVIGRNKLVDDPDFGFARIRAYACPPNARRLGLQTPCALTGKCTDCSSPQRMCNAFLTLERKPGAHPMEVWLVDGDLGF